MCGGGGDTGVTADQEEDANRQARIARERQQAIVSQQTQQATDFRNKIPDFENQLDEQLTDTARHGLAQDLQSNKVDVSRRGLLHSNLNDMNQGTLRAQSGAKLAAARSGVSTQLQNQADSMDQQAAQGALGDYTQRQQAEDSIYNRAMQQVQQRQQLYGQIGQAGGTAGGLALAAL